MEKAVFKLTDCPRNVEHSAIPPDKEDLLSVFVHKMLHVTSNFSARQQSWFLFFPFQLKLVFPPYPSGKSQLTSTLAIRLDPPLVEKQMYNIVQ